jgi:hypothetical protein
VTGQVHVRPTRTGLWQVYIGESAQAASHHETATDAERSAAALAAALERAEIVLHDAYHRCRSIRTDKLPRSPEGRSRI